MESLFKDWMRVINKPLLIKTLSSIPQTGICPKKEDVFNAFTLCSLRDCRVIFLGQDPYPQKNIATGILFGNNIENEDNLSPSLKIIKEASIDYTKHHNYPIEFDNSLESWAKQGILMINSALTTKENEVGSHTQLWRPFVSNLIENICKYGSNYVFVLFGKQAQTFEPYINRKSNYILKENHPAFYARTNTRMPSDVFYKINNYLKSQYNQEIIWYNEFNLNNYG